MTQIREFGTTKDGRTIHAIDLSSGTLRATFLTYGACLNDLRMDGVDHPLTPGSPDFAAYEGPLAHHGTLIGPMANRITGAKVEIGGVEHQLERRDGLPFTLHSGSKGTQYKIWDIKSHGPSFVEFGIDLPDCCDGFPGNRTVSATFTLDQNTLTLDITARTDEATVFNFANHSFWTLDAALGYTGQVLTVHADHVTAVNDMLCPTGGVDPVDHVGLDFRVGRGLKGSDAEFIDHNFCTSNAQTALRDVAVLEGKDGITMTMSTTEPGLQVYDCGTISSKGFETHHGQDYELYHAPALEAQNWPDAPSHVNFPTALTLPYQPYRQTTKWAFSKK